MTEKKKGAQKKKREGRTRYWAARKVTQWNKKANQKLLFATRGYLNCYWEETLNKNVEKGADFNFGVAFWDTTQTATDNTYPKLVVGGDRFDILNTHWARNTPRSGRCFSDTVDLYWVTDRRQTLRGLMDSRVSEESHTRVCHLWKITRLLKNIRWLICEVCAAFHQISLKTPNSYKLFTQFEKWTQWISAPDSYFSSGGLLWRLHWQFKRLHLGFGYPNMAVSIL